MRVHPNHFATLQVHRSSTTEEITIARRQLARLYHPDVNDHPTRMMEINEAHHVLTDPGERARYLAIIEPEPVCAFCDGHGMTRKFRGFSMTQAIITICPSCGGCGRII